MKKKLLDSEESKKELVQEVVELAEKDTKEETVNLEPTPEDVLREKWMPKTEIGRKVKSGVITDIDQVLESCAPVLETEIIDLLLPNMESDLLLIGQAKGKFGGGQRRVFRQTQKKTSEGNKPQFAACAVVGNMNGYVGVGYGKSKETVPSRDKALRNAKLNLFKIRRGAGSWEDVSKEPHSIPFAVVGKCGSIVVKLMPAPKGKGLVVETECAKILKMAGIKNVWSHTSGHTKTKYNLIQATVDALRQLMVVKVQPSHHVVEGRDMGESL